MRYIDCKGAGGSEVLHVAEGSLPRLDNDQVLIHVRAAGVNRPDILQRQGLYSHPKEASRILGLEVSGVVVEVAKDVDAFAVGDNVYALTNGGGYAEYTAVPSGQVFKMTRSLSWQQAAVLPEALLTVFSNVFIRANLRKGERCLVHGGSGGIGSTAIQMIKAFGSEVYTTCRSNKVDFCRSLGADHVIPYDTSHFSEFCLEQTKGRGVDVILDMVGGDYVDKNIRCAAENGRIINIAFMAGSVMKVNLMRLMLKRLTLSGSTLRSESAGYKRRLTDGVRETFSEQIESGRISPALYEEYDLFDIDSVRTAHDVMESGAVRGKLVLVNNDAIGKGS